MSNIRKQLAAQYSLTRTERPDADAEAIAVMITSRLGNKGRIDLVASELLLNPQATNQPNTALDAVRSFVNAIEEDEADDNDPR